MNESAFEGFSTDDEENEPTEQEIPLAVLDSFNEAFPHAADVFFKVDSNEEGETAYAVDFMDQGVEIEAFYSADGTLLKIKS